jgi:hypothetical protein
VTIDYKQAQLRLAAYLSKDQKLLNYLKSGTDPYQALATEIGISRDLAKVISIGVLFGLGTRSIGAQARIPQEEAQEVVRNYKQKFPVMFKWIDSMKDKYRGSDNIQSPFGGFTYTVPKSKVEKKYKDADPGTIEYFHDNAKIAGILQSAESDILRKALQDLRAKGIDVVGTMHDAIMLHEGVTDEQILEAKAIMENVLPGNFLEAEIQNPPQSLKANKDAKMSLNILKSAAHILCKQGEEGKKIARDIKALVDANAKLVEDALKKHEFLHVIMQDDDPGHDVLRLNPDGSVTLMFWTSLGGDELFKRSFPTFEEFWNLEGSYDQSWWIPAAQSPEGAVSDGPDAFGGPITEQELEQEVRDYFGD